MTLRLLIVIAVVGVLGGASSAQAEKSGGSTYGGYVLAEDKASRTLSAQLNLAMIRVATASFARIDTGQKWVPLELRFDAGNLRKRDLSRAQKHFNQMVRRIGMGQMDEAHEQLFRAERFIKKTFPYSMDFSLLAEIVYYRSRVDAGLGKDKESAASYCRYLYLMSNLSRSAIPIGQKVEDLSTCDAEDETGELVVTARKDVGIIYVDGAPAGVVDPKTPFVSPFLARGLHFVEVRSPGRARWGQVVEIKPGKTLKIKARLKRARSGVNERELQPLEGIVLHGTERSDDAYVQDILFQYAQEVGVDNFILGKVRKMPNGAFKLALVRFKDGELSTIEETISDKVFEFDPVMLAALRNLGVSVSSLGAQAPEERPEFLYFKVK